MLFGKAISITKTSVPPALSYPFTSHFGISHGHAVSLTFNEFLSSISFTQKNQKKKTVIKDLQDII